MRTALILMLPALFVPIREPFGKSPAADGKIEVKVVKFDALADAVKSQRGKVVVVYCWAAYNPPSMRMLPSVVELHKKYADKGLASMTLSLDPDPTNSKDRIQKFLDRTKTTLQSFILDEPAEDWSEYLGVLSPPAVVILDRNGKRVASIDLTQLRDESESLMERTEKIVSKLMAEGRR